MKKYYSPDILPRWQLWILRFCPKFYDMDYEEGCWIVSRCWLGKFYVIHRQICHVDGITKLHQDVFQPRNQIEILERCYWISDG